MSIDNKNTLETLFHPKSVAIVGASPKRHASGNRWLNALMNFSFQGRLYPVHPTADTILSLKAYPSVKDIPGEVDLVIFAIPFTAAMDVMSDCVDKGVKYVQMFTAGFSETGEEKNTRLEQDLVILARKGGVRIVGPNCMGLYCPEGSLSWAGHFPQQAGRAGMVSQSGGLAFEFITMGGREGIYFSKVVSYGNACDLKCHDFLNYLADDDKTELICAYVEGLTHGREFFEAAKRITAKKPLIIWKGGQTSSGARTTQSHTASIAGSQAIWDAICKQTGIISVNSMDELIYTTLGFLNLPMPKGKRVAILGGAGGGSVTMSDMIEKEGLDVPRLAQETIDKLKTFVPISGNFVTNPLDLSFSSVYHNQEQFTKLFTHLGEDPNIDAVLYVRGVGGGEFGRTNTERLVSMTMGGIKTAGKPAFVTVSGRGNLDSQAVCDETQAQFRRAGLTTFESMQMAARVLFNMSEYNSFVSRKEP